MRLYDFPPLALTIDPSGGSALAEQIVVPRDGAIAEWALNLAPSAGAMEPSCSLTLHLPQSVLNTADWMFWKGGL